LHELTKI
jgi:methionyl-tRNA synthetase